MNPFQYAVNNVKKKASELFNNSAPVQGARIYSGIAQNPQLAKSMAQNAIVNTQRYIESPKTLEVPQLAPFNKKSTLGQIGNFATNLGAQAVGTPVTALANNVLGAANVIGRQIDRKSVV